MVRLTPGRRVILRVLLVGALLGWYVFAAVGAGWNKSNTFDEPLHLIAGYSYWKTGDSRLLPESPLIQRLATIPIAWGNFASPSFDQKDWKVPNPWGLGHQLLFGAKNDAGAILHRGRAIIALLGAALGLIVYLWSSRLFGPICGCISLILFSFCPTTLAHGGMITTDMGAALFFFASVGALWKVLHRITLSTVLASALAMAGLFVTKFSAVLIVPMGLLLLAIRVIVGKPMTVAIGQRAWTVHNRWQQLLVGTGLIGVHVAVTWVVIWAVFGFRYATTPGLADGASIHDWSVVDTVPGTTGEILQWARRTHFLPEPYIYGFGTTVAMSGQRVAFFNGEVGIHGWRTFFPYAVLVKTPIPLFVILVAALLAVFTRWRAVANATGITVGRQFFQGFYETAPLWVLWCVYWATAIASHLNIGHRHVLPVYPVMYMFAGASGLWLTRPKWLDDATESSAGAGSTPPVSASSRLLPRVMSVLTCAACLAFIAESLFAWPNYLAYFNQVAGGSRNGYRHLVDSSLDWGQDLPGLKKWLVANGLDNPAGTPVYLSYFGSARPDYYEINANVLPSFIEMPPGRLRPLEGGVYCISATMLQPVYIMEAFGAWNSAYEETYKMLTRNVVIFSEADASKRDELMKQYGAKMWNDTFRKYDRFRFSRLCAHLREREPSDNVGGSILIYKLSQDDINRALYGSPPISVKQLRIESGSLRK